MMRVKLLISLIPVLGVQLLVAQIPQTISYQGVLTDNATPPNPLDGTFVLRFNLFADKTGGAALGTPEWSEDLSAIVSQGVFSVILGETTSFSSAGVYFTDPYWLEISIVEDGGGTVRTLAPRVQLSAVPYAIKSRGVSGSANIFRGSGNVGIGTTSPDTKLEVEGASGDAVLVKLNQTGGINWVGLNLERDDVQKWHIGMNGTDDYLRFRRASSSDDMVIDESGNVGIGTDIPSAKLDVAGDANVQGNLAVTGTITQSARTEYYSFGARDYIGVPGQPQPDSTNYVQSWFDDFMFEKDSLNGTIPLHLPQGVTITDITIYVDDNDNTNDAECSLYVWDNNSFTALESTLSPWLVFSATGTGTLSPTEPLPTPHTVDNQTNIYWLRITAAVPSSTGPYIRFYGGYITYTVN